MRTKTLLCAAAIAAGVTLSAVAQNVYSLNVVGYVNVPVPAGYSLLANPLSTGVTNGANEIMPIIDGSIFVTFNAGAYVYRGYDSGFGGWVDALNNPATPPALPPGTGFFFFNPGDATTLTFVGEVVPRPGVTNSLALASGYQLIGTPMPVGGTLPTTPTAATPVAPGTLNMPVIDGEILVAFNAGSYVYRGYDSGFGGWVDALNNSVAAPSVSIGQGFFFFNPDVPTTWQQALP